MKKEDLKVGYLVKARNGTVRMVMPKWDSDEGLIMISEMGSWASLDNFNDSLEFVKDRNVDIMKVWGRSLVAYRVLEFDPEDRELLWERKEETPELTNDERTILKNLDKRYKYIERDVDGDLIISKRPSGECYAMEVAEGAVMELGGLQHLFQFITYESDKFYNIKALLGEGKK